jgi:hypothetical protein
MTARDKMPGVASTVCFPRAAVMPGLVPGIHVFLYHGEGVDGRDKPGHDKLKMAEAYFKFPQKRWMRRQASSRSSVLVA